MRHLQESPAVELTTLLTHQAPIFKISSPSSSSPWRPGFHSDGCRRDGRSSGRCCGWQNWSSVGSFWLSSPFPLSVTGKDTEISFRIHLWRIDYSDSIQMQHLLYFLLLYTSEASTALCTSMLPPLGGTIVLVNPLIEKSLYQIYTKKMSVKKKMFTPLKWEKIRNLTVSKNDHQTSFADFYINSAQQIYFN